MELPINLVILIPAARGVLPRVPFPVGDQIGVGDQFQVFSARIVSVMPSLTLIRIVSWILLNWLSDSLYSK